ncbi:MAG: hypothetical protein LLG06_14950 [Desulfobacteraceae bacterium]|nr:hypothetical protein [Desulfobacteraceae bacterium]
MATKDIPEIDGKVLQQLMAALHEKDRLTYAAHFVQGFVHNANGPLQNLTMLAEMLMSGLDMQDRLFRSASCDPEKWSQLVEKQRKRLTQIRDQVFHLAGDLREFMQLHEVERGGTEIDINSLLSRMARVFRADLFFKHQVKSELRLAGNLPHIKILGRDIVPALYHLFQNAVFSMRTSPTKELTVETRMGENAILVRITDTGCGLGECEDSECLFVPFETRWPRSETPSQMGCRNLGFGLYAARQLLLPYGCTVTLEPNETGVTAAVSMPLPQKQA